MTDKPLLAIPQRHNLTPPNRRGGGGTIVPKNLENHKKSLNEKLLLFQRAIYQDNSLGVISQDKESILHDRTIVFEIAGDILDFKKNAEYLGFKYLHEDIDKNSLISGDFLLKKYDSKSKAYRNEESDSIKCTLYMLVPSKSAIDSLFSLWKKYKNGEDIGRGFAPWKGIFNQLYNIRKWGPKDRLTKESIEYFNDILNDDSGSPVNFEVEFWYSDDETKRNFFEKSVVSELDKVGGVVKSKSTIDAIKYHALLVEAPAISIKNMIDNPDIGIASVDGVMFVSPQSTFDVSDVGDEEHESYKNKSLDKSSILKQPIALVLDGSPMLGHELLVGRVDFYDYFDYDRAYGNASDRIHGTAISSAVIYGDLSQEPVSPIGHKIHLWPVMYPNYKSGGTSEFIPDDRLVVDLFYELLVSMLERDNGELLKSIHIINISLGCSNVRFNGYFVSPWARLIDYISWKYNKLVIVSAGNILDEFDVGCKWADLESANAEDRETIVLSSIYKNMFKRSLLSPSESVNAITVGSCDFDYSDGQLGSMQLYPYNNKMLPSVSSAYGPGPRNSVKPDILMPGGRHPLGFKSSDNNKSTIYPAKSFTRGGIRIARPDNLGKHDSIGYMQGTSCAAALATHNAIKIYESLEKLSEYSSGTTPNIDPAYYPVVLKALIIHCSMRNQDAHTSIKKIINNQGLKQATHVANEISRMLGYGVPDISRVLECSDSRVTLLGYGEIFGDESFAYTIPLPDEIEGKLGDRYVTITVAYLSPISNDGKYIGSRIDVIAPVKKLEDIISNGESLSQPPYNQSTRGTVYHRRWNSSNASTFQHDGNIEIGISCKSDTPQAIRYAIAVTLEVDGKMGIPVYNSVRNKLVPISPMP